MSLTQIQQTCLIDGTCFTCGEKETDYIKFSTCFENIFYGICLFCYEEFDSSYFFYPYYFIKSMYNEFRRKKRIRKFLLLKRKFNIYLSFNIAKY